MSKGQTPTVSWSSGATLRELGTFITAGAGRGIGFALFVDLRPVQYTSTSKREDVLELLREWCTRYDRRMVNTARARVGGPLIKETRNEVEREDDDPEVLAHRDELGQKCKALGERIARRFRCGLFLFDLGGGRLVYWTNMPEFRKGVGAWIVST